MAMEPREQLATTQSAVDERTDGTTQLELKVKELGKKTCAAAGTLLSQKTKIKTLVFLHHATTGSLCNYIWLYVQSTGATVAQIGVLQATQSLTGLIAEPIWGGLFDMGCPEIITMVIAFLLASSLRLLVLFTKAFPVFLVAKLLETVAGVPVFMLLDRAVLHSVSRDTSEYGSMSVFGKFGNGVAVLVASQAVHKLSSLGLGNGYGGAFLVYICLALPSFFSTPCLLSPYSIQKAKERAKTNHQTDKNSQRLIIWSKQVLAALKPIAARLFCLQTCLLGFTEGVIGPATPMQLEAIGAAPEDFAIIIGVTQAISLCLGTVVLHQSGKLIKRVGGASNYLLISLAIMTQQLILVALIRNPYLAIPAFTLTTINWPIMWAALTIQADRLAPQGLQATLLGLRSCCLGGIGRSLGALVGSAVASSWGIPSMMLAQAALNIVVLIIFCFPWCHRVRTSDDELRLELMTAIDGGIATDDDSEEEAKLSFGRSSDTEREKPTSPKLRCNFPASADIAYTRMDDDHKPQDSSQERHGKSKMRNRENAGPSYLPVTNSPDEV